MKFPQAPVLLLSVWCLLAGCKQAAAPVDPALALEEAWQYFRTSEFSLATTNFKNAVDSSSSSDPLHPQALFGLATTAELQRPDPKPALAKTLYEKITREHGASEYAQWSALALARMKAQPDYNVEPEPATALAAFQTVNDRFPGTLVGDETLMRQQMTRLVTDDKKQLHSIIDTLTDFNKKRPGSLFAPTSWWIIASAALALDDSRLARDSFQQCYDAAIHQKTSVMRGEVAIDEITTLYTIASLSEFKLGDFDTARKCYRQIIIDGPRDWRTFTARQAIERMDRIEAGGSPDVPGISTRLVEKP